MTTTKTKMTDELKARLDAARRARVEQAAQRGRDPREHRDAGLMSEEAMAGLVETYVDRWRRPPRRRSDVATVKAKLAKAAGRARKHAARGELRRYSAAQLGEMFPDDAELADLLLEDAAAREAKAARAEREREREAVDQLAGQVEREREAAAKEDARAEAARRLGVEA